MITSLKTEDIDCVCEECGKTFNLDNPKAVLSTDRDLWSVKCPHCEQWGYMNPINVAQETKQMSNKYYIGLDPGSKGALTVLHGESIESVAFDDYDISDICYKLRDLVNYNSVYAVVEDVHAVFGSSAKGTFEFGYNKGWIVGMLTALNIPYSMIPPKKWQSGVWERCDKVMEGKKVKIDRSKGLGENDPDMMWLTTMNPETRRLIKVMPDDVEETARMFDLLLGDNLQGRKDHIAENGYKKIQNHTWHSRAHDMLRELETTFHVSFIQDGEGAELDFQIEYPDKQTLILDAIYQLNRMSVLASNDLCQTEHISQKEIALLSEYFRRFQQQFSNHLDGLELSPYIEHSLHCKDTENLEHIPELFSIQCRAIMGNLLLSMTNLKL